MAAVLVAALAGPLVSTASADQYVSCWGQAPRKCLILEPNVKQDWTEYSDVQLAAGDHVLIQAGGCVQTGGKGKTWKRYVDPAANNDLYHGLIYFPGAMTPGHRLQALVNTTVTVPYAGHLFLGYQDDGYADHTNAGYNDNGYWGHDDGTGDQCKNVENAWVLLTIS
jgi:hypothetical protein